jgi:hypothetical protein
MILIMIGKQAAQPNNRRITPVVRLRGGEVCGGCMQPHNLTGGYGGVVRQSLRDASPPPWRRST